jgi:hypothetical protein
MFDKCSNPENGKILDEMNKEILKLRNEIYRQYHNRLIEIYDKSTVNVSLEYFLASPISYTKGRSSFAFLVEICEDIIDFKG